MDKRSAWFQECLTLRARGWDSRGVNVISGLFDAWYWILVAVLVVLVPAWLGKFLYEATATIQHRRRERRATGSAEPRAPAERPGSGHRRN